MQTRLRQADTRIGYSLKRISGSRSLGELQTGVFL